MSYLTKLKDDDIMNINLRKVVAMDNSDNSDNNNLICFFQKLFCDEDERL